MAPIHVSLSNELESKDAALTKVDSICIPVDKNGEGIPNPSAYLTCYRIKEDRGKTRLTAQRMTLTDQFGGRQVVVVKGRSLCVPSLKSP